MFTHLENRFHDTVSALAYSFARANAGPAAGPPPFNDLTQFILRQHAQLPDYLRTPMLLAALGFDTAGMVRGKPFHAQSAEQRQHQINAWKKSNAAFQRDLIRYFESLATFALYSRGETDGVPAVPEISGTVVIDRPQPETSAEIVVIGSGPGGAITACLLAEAGRNVLLIEEGAFRAQNSCAAFSRDEMAQKYRNGGQTVSLGENKISYVEGRCVGGGSEINSALYHRTPPEILDQWRREFQVDGLSDGEMRPHFETCEREVSVSPLPCPAPAASLKLHAGATGLGWKSLEAPRWFRYEPNSANGKRQSMTETFIPRFLKAGGKILPRARVRRLSRNGSQWTLDVNRDSQTPLRVTAGIVFICAGAVQTPTLLHRSGITENIGDSLQMHPTVKIVARFPDAVNAADLGVPVHQVKEFAPRLSFGCSISSPAHLALGLLDHPASLRNTLQDWTHMAVYYAMITSEGRGRVRPLPGFADPLVRYVLTENDRANLADGFHKLAAILFESGATALYPGLANGPVLLRREDAGKLPEILPAGQASLMTIHLFSSCPMGEDRARCATNSFGRVHGFKNLFINDASLLCTAPGVNPQGSIMAIARRNTLNFLQQNRI